LRNEGGLGIDVGSSRKKNYRGKKQPQKMVQALYGQEKEIGLEKTLLGRWEKQNRRRTGTDRMLRKKKESGDESFREKNC